MKTLIMAEKPSVARDLAHVLRPQAKKGPDSLESSDMVFTWALGHLLSLQDADGYDPRYKVWRLDDLPIIPPELKFRTLAKTQAHLKTVAALLNRPDIERVVNACDAGREGELIFREISRYAGLSKPVMRLWLSETTPDAVRKAYAGIKPQAAYDHLAEAAFLRQEADWLVGINASRVFSVRHRQRLSVGRVQTPTLALLVSREQEIEQFSPQTFYQLQATFETVGKERYRGLWVIMGEGRTVEQDRFGTKEEAQEHIHPLPRQAVVADATESAERVLPPLFPNLSDVQREANRMFGLTATKTLGVLQELYEKGYVSYPRTDSRHLTDSLAQGVGARLGALQSQEAFGPAAGQALAHLGQFHRYGKRYVDNTKVSDHHAIIVTAKSPPATLAGPGEQIYRLIARRFLAAFFPPAIFAVREVISKDQEFQDFFRSTHKTRIEEGFQVLFPPSKESSEPGGSEDFLPAVRRGDVVDVAGYTVHEGVTKAPARYTEAALLGAMETAGRKLDDPALKDVMKTAGLGTPATRAAIIERLITVGYVQRQKKLLLPTDKGKALVALVPDLLTQVMLTAQWEDKLKAVEEGRAPGGDFRQAIHGFTRDIVEQARTAPAADFPAAEVQSAGGVCPLCGSPLRSFPKGYRCSKQKDLACAFVLWTTIAGKTLTPLQVETLLQKGRTRVMRGFKSKAGKPFQAALVLEKGAVRFDFDAASKPAPKATKPRSRTRK